MDFRGSIASARSHTLMALQQLDRYDRSSRPDTNHNRQVLDSAIDHISPGATSAGAAALDASRWERWVTIRQIRDTGTALALLDRAWWGLNDRSGQPDLDGARRSLHEAVTMLDRASWSSGRWAATPAPQLLPVGVAVVGRVA